MIINEKIHLNFGLVHKGGGGRKSEVIQTLNLLIGVTLLLCLALYSSLMFHSAAAVTSDDTWY